MTRSTKTFGHWALDPLPKHSLADLFMLVLAGIYHIGIGWYLWVNAPDEQPAIPFASWLPGVFVIAGMAWAVIPFAARARHAPWSRLTSLAMTLAAFTSMLMTFALTVEISRQAKLL